MADFCGEKACGPTHHFACQCREAMFMELDKSWQEFVSMWVESYESSKEGKIYVELMLSICKQEIKVQKLRQELGLIK